MADLSQYSTEDLQKMRAAALAQKNAAVSKPEEGASEEPRQYDLSQAKTEDLVAYKEMLEKQKLYQEGKTRVKERMAAPDEYAEVPVYGPDGAATGATERVLKPKADPIGSGAFSVLPFGSDIAMLGRGQVPFSDEYAREKQRYAGEEEAQKEAYPTPYTVGQGGSLALQLLALKRLPLPGATWGTKALPEGAAFAEKAAALAKRIAGAGAGGATIGGIGGLGEGTGVERLKGAATGATVGGVLGSLSVPVVEGALGAGKTLYSKIVDPLVQTARGGMNPTLAAEEAAARSLATGRRMTAEGPSEFEYLLSKGEPVMIGDVGGEPTKALARSAANISPEARETLTEATRDRFLTQTARTTKDIQNFFPGSVDYVETIDALHRAAKKANSPAYKRAYEQGSSGIFNEELYNLMQAPAVQDAMKGVTKRAKNQEVYGEPRGKVVDPFAFDKEGQLVAKQGMKATEANLAYWDIVKQNLDDEVSALYRAGRGGEAGDLATLRNSLRDTLDDLVPTYKNARGTAKKFFGAENAFEAGINFNQATGSRQVSELFDAWKGFSAPEKELFARGYTSNLLQKVGKSKDNTSIINQSFMGGSPTDRAKNLMALGRDRANALEARLRVEQMMDTMRPAVSGGSTTARQIAEYGLASGAGAGVGSFQDAASPGAIAGILLKAGKGRVDSKVAEEVAKILTSRDPKLLQKLTEMASKDSKILQSLRVLQNETPLFPNKAAILSGGIGEVAADQGKPQPKELTIKRGP